MKEKNKKEKLIPVVVRLDKGKKQGEVLSRLLGDDMHKDFVKMLSKARDKANYYITHDVEGIDKKDLYDFYEIGDIYRNE